MDNKKYISVEDAIKTTWMILDGLGYAFDENPQLTEAVLAVFDTAQTADVRPVLRGKWMKRMEEKETPYYKSFTPIWSCSECGTEYDPSVCMTINFCQNCGADMRETNDEKA